MTTDEFLNLLRSVRSSMFTKRVGEFFLQQHEQTRNDFLDARLKIMHIVDRLEIAQLQNIANELTQNEQEFKDAIDNLKKELNDLGEAIAIINTISHVVSVVNQIAGIIL